jgi:acetyl esterase/lipase
MTLVADALAQVQPTLLGASIADQRATWESSGASQPLPEGIDVRGEEVDGVPVDVVTAAEAEGQAPIVHLHGGGYCIGSPRTHRAFAARLSRSMGRPVVLPDYRLAPEHRFPAAVGDSLAVYAALSAAPDASPVVLSGDSAGGGLAVATALAAAGGGLPAPAALVCWSPWVDLAAAALDEPDRAGDPVLSVDWLGLRAADYLGQADVADPLASPLHGDLEGLPPMLVMVGSRELLRPQAGELAKRAAASGVDVELEEFAGAIHLWMVWLPDAPESAAAFERAAAFVRGRAGRRGAAPVANA